MTVPFEGMNVEWIATDRTELPDDPDEWYVTILGEVMHLARYTDGLWVRDDGVPDWKPQFWLKGLITETDRVRGKAGLRHALITWLLYWSGKLPEGAEGALRQILNHPGEHDDLWRQGRPGHLPGQNAQQGVPVGAEPERVPPDHGGQPDSTV